MAGVLLARAGIDTLVLEKHGDFLRDFRGDTIHPSTMDVLGELGWLDDFLRLPHDELTRVGAHVGDVELDIADYSRSPTRKQFIALMPQWDFLDFLVGKAREFPRFSVRMNTEATDLIEEDGRVVGVRSRTPEGELEVRADLVIAADGRRSVLRESAGLRVRDLGVPIDVLWLRLSRLESDPPQSLGWMRRGRFLALINRGTYWQIASVIKKGGFDAIRGAGIDAFRRELGATIPFLAQRVNELSTIDDVKLLVVKVDRLERWWKTGLLCIGDAAHAMSPIGGVGINLAIQDAVAAANLLAQSLRQGTLSDRELASVQRRRDLPTKLTQAAQVFIQNRVISKALQDGAEIRPSRALRFLANIPVLRSVPAYLVGVGVRPEHVRSPLSP
jgi:2-polyprenyl-6-methoxyphenol hydroxylase-like FAD-dependent oxidoreductase